MNKKAIFHLEQNLDDFLHIGPHEKSRILGRNRFDPLSGKKEKEEEDKPVVFLSLWVYTHRGELDDVLSKLNVPYTKDELEEMSIMTFVTKPFATRETINHFDVHVCFRRIRDEGIGPTEQVESPKEFDFFPKLPIEELNQTPVTRWVGGPVFTDVCGFILRSKKEEFSWLPITLRYKIDEKAGVESLFRPFPSDIPLSDNKQTLVSVLSGEADMLLNEEVGPLGLTKGWYRRVLFTPLDTLDTIYDKVFSSSGNEYQEEAWGNYEKLIRYLGKMRSHKDLNRTAITYAIDHMQTSERIAPSRQWVFVTYAPYVIRAKYSANGNTFKNVIFPYGIRVMGGMDEETFLTNPERHTDDGVLVDQSYVIWRPVYITDESMAGYIQKTRGSRFKWTETMDLAEMLWDSSPREDSSPMLVELIGSMYAFRDLAQGSMSSNYAMQYLLWSSDGNYSMLRQTTVPEKMSAFSGAKNAFVPRVTLNIDYTSSNLPFLQKRRYMQESVRVYDPREYEYDLGHRKEMSFEEYVELQDAFAATVKDSWQMPKSLLFADTEDPVSIRMANILEDTEREKLRGFYQAWLNKDPYISPV
jgi:hypothetical protein